MTTDLLSNDRLDALLCGRLGGVSGSACQYSGQEGGIGQNGPVNWANACRKDACHGWYYFKSKWNLGIGFVAVGWIDVGHEQCYHRTDEKYRSKCI